MTDWRASSQYQRIMEILDDYWLSESEEQQVTVCMTFKHSDGSTQSKRIVWTNPKYCKRTSHKKPMIKKLSGVSRPTCACM